MTEENSIPLSSNVKKQLGLQNGDEVEVMVSQGVLRLQPLPKTERPQTKLPIVTAIIAMLIFVIYFKNQHMLQIPLSGKNSIAMMSLTITTLCGIFNLIVALVYLKRHATANLKAVSWRHLPTISIAFGLISFMLMDGLFWIMNTLFKGATFDLLTATIIFTLINYIESNAMLRVLPALSARLLTNVFIAIIVSGVMVAMVSNQNMYWWKQNLSFLGTNNALNSWQFNLALIFSGLILIALVDYLFVSLKSIFQKDKRLLTLRILLTLLAVDLAAVGFFPNDADLHSLHDRVAGYLVYFVLILIIGVKWLLPNIDYKFLRTSWLIAGSLVLAEILFQLVGYLSLTAFEILAFMLAFTWLVMLFERLNDYLEPTSVQTYTIK